MGRDATSFVWDPSLDKGLSDRQRLWGEFQTGASQTCIVGYRIDLLMPCSSKLWE
jgi:hypothetical protein